MENRAKLIQTSPQYMFVMEHHSTQGILGVAIDSKLHTPLRREQSMRLTTSIILSPIALETATPTFRHGRTATAIL